MWNLGKGAAIVVALLALRWVVLFMDRMIRGDTAREEQRQASLVRGDPEAFAVVVPAVTQEEAQRIGHAVIESRLAAYAAMIGPNHALSHDPFLDRRDAFLVLLTRRRRLKKLQRRIRSLHSSEDSFIYLSGLRQGYKPFMKQVRKGTRKIGW